MTPEEMYEFDLNGYIIYRDLIPPELVRRMNDILDVSLTKSERRQQFSFIDQDPCFLELMAHPRTLQIIRVMIGDWLRLDHAYGIEMSHDTEVHENLHGGPRDDQGEHCYQWVQGRMYNGLIVVMYALEDVNPGDGGLVCVPGSHKANVPYRPRFGSHLVVNPSFKAGDMLIFTEALVHGSSQWKSTNRRRSLLYKYSPGYSAWGPADRIEALSKLATTDLQRDLLRPPSVGRRKALDFPAI